MGSALGEYFQKVRREKGLRIAEVSRLVGYKNRGKGCRRIDSFEATGQIMPDLLTKLAACLEIENKVIADCLDQDRRAYQEWLSEPVKRYVILRLMAAVYSRVDLPENVQSQQQAEDFASGLAKEHRLRTCLVWSRRLSIYFKKDGSLEGIMEAASAPTMTIGGRECFLNIDDGTIGVVPVGENKQEHQPEG